MIRIRRRCENPLCSWCHAPAEWTDIVAAFVAPVLIIALAVYALAACTLHVVVRTEPVARVVPLDAPEQHPSLYGLPMGDGGPCSLLTTSSAYGSADPCAAATYTIDAPAPPTPDWMQL